MSKVKQLSCPLDQLKWYSSFCQNPRKLVQEINDGVYGVVLKVFFDFSLTVKAAPHECVIRTGQP